MPRLEDDVAIVTGAARGIGAAYAKALAEEGAKVVVSDILDTKTTVDEINGSGGTAIGVGCDVTDNDAVDAMVNTVISEYGKIDALVNNAAVFADITHKRFEDIPDDEWAMVMQVNIQGVWRVSKAVVPHMRERQYGKIVNVASTTALKGTPMMLHYVSSKGAILGMTKSMAREVGEDNICVNAIAPGLVISDGIVQGGNWNEDWIDNNTNTRAIKRRAMPEDMVGTIVFLSSREANFITGQTVAVDGGSVPH
ncbi:MAG: dehydrogenase [Rhodospirillaceae bacterium]|nr:dehydrogenase [Rhodospirillaceae bacterium]|tara:strand:- start:716 stop:1474 length:759 start_codon:yes stop_codon:yes gene_type:complete